MLAQPPLKIAAAVLAVAALVSPRAAVGATVPTPAGLPLRTLYVTSGDTNDITIFDIGSTGALTPAGPLVPTGDQPRGIMFSPDGSRAYVANSGADEISVYAVGGDGSLSLLGTVPTGTTPFAMAVDPDGKAVYVTNIDDGTISAFAVTGDGMPTPLGAPINAGGPDPSGMAMTPDGRFMFVPHGRPDDTAPRTVTTFAVRPDHTLLQEGTGTPVGPGSVGSAISRDGRFLYVTSRLFTDGPNDSHVFGFRIGADGGLTPVPGSPFDARDFPEGIMAAPDGRHLYVGSVDTNDVHEFTIGDDGTLTPADHTFPAGSGPVWITATPDGRHLYVDNRDSADVIAYDIEQGGGLRKIGDFTTGGSGSLAESVAVRPDQPPKASFTARTSETTVRFDATASTDTDGRIVRYDWNFGDGTFAENAGPTPAHVYRHPGTYQVTLVVADDQACSTTLVYTGQTTLCNGSPAARTTHPITTRQ